MAKRQKFVTMKVEGLGELLSDLKRLGRKVGMTSGEAVSDLAQTGTRGLAAATLPKGLTGKQEAKLKESIDMDIKQTYTGVGQTYHRLSKRSRRAGAAYLSAVKSGNTQGADRITEKYLSANTLASFDSGSALRRRRTSRGRVPNQGGNPEALLNRSGVKSFTKRKLKRAGMAKAGWYQASLGIKGKARTYPKWVKGHKGNLGSAKYSRRRTSTIITVSNNVRYVDYLLPQFLLNRALKNSHKAVVRKYKKQIEKLKI
tara:strand:+ start:291 stop:1064 length:774 start_codon:yes stop_codon:yes gene_type:complete